MLAFIDQMQRTLGQRDYVAMGNGLMDYLFSLSAISHAAWFCSEVEQWLRKGIESRFGLPAGCSYTMTHHDDYLPAELRGRWKEDTLPKFIILAYVIGSSRRNLPSPHQKLIPYYLFVAEKQIAHIEATKAALHRKQHNEQQQRQESTAQERIRQFRAKAAHDGMDPKLIEAQVRYLQQQQGVAPAAEKQLVIQCPICKKRLQCPVGFRHGKIKCAGCMNIIGVA